MYVWAAFSIYASLFTTARADVLLDIVAEVKAREAELSEIIGCVTLGA